jgi:glycosyltransferase involved in cell wall biosynthesis
MQRFQDATLPLLYCKGCGRGRFIFRINKTGMKNAVGAGEHHSGSAAWPEAQRVRQVLYHHRTQGKGVEGVHIRGIADAMRASGIAVHILSIPGADPYASPVSMSPARQATLLMRLVAALPEPVFELTEILYNVVVLARLYGYLRQHRDTDLIYERYSLFMFASALIARWQRIPLILEVNDATFVKRVRPLFLQSPARWIERWLFRRADGLVFVSALFRDRAMAAHGRLAPSIVTPNAADVDKFSATPQQREATRARYGLQDSVVCGYVGAFVPWHAIEQFVYRIAGRLTEVPELKLLLVGDGASFNAVQTFVRDHGLERRVLLAGRVPHVEVPALLAAMDLAILPSAGDYTSPVKLFEFMAAGIAPIAPDFMPIREVLREGQTGWMFKAEDLEAAVCSVIEHCHDRQALQRVGRAARDYVAAQRQWRNNVLQLLELHASLRCLKPR